MRSTLTRRLLLSAACLCAAACLPEPTLARPSLTSPRDAALASVETGDRAGVVAGLRDRLADAERQLADATTPERLVVTSPTDRERAEILARAAAALAGDLDALDASDVEDAAWREAARSLDRRLEAVNRGLDRLAPRAPASEGS
jgi:hypothetical protein